MIHIAVCDDEQYMLDQISERVFAYFHVQNEKTSERGHTHIEVTSFSSGEALLKSDKTYDILFLDIQMKGLDGMETARRLRSRGFRGCLIFITVLKEMVFQAFEVQAFDYLVKPIEVKHFDKMMDRLLASMRNSTEKSLLIQRGYESRIVPFEDIVYCEIIGRKVYLHLVSSEVVDYYDRIESLETKLGSRFYRCHRSYLIHMKYLQSYKNGIAKMAGDIEIPVSRLRSKEFSEVILRYMKNS